MAVSTVATPVPVGNENRGLFADWFNAKDIAAEDFNRNVQLAQYEHELNLEGMNLQNAFNSAEAEKQRAWEERLANSQYQRATEDLKKAGLNPILAYTNMQANTPSGASASSSSGVGTRTKGAKNSSVKTSDAMSSLVNLASTAISLAVGLYGSAAAKGVRFGFGK